MLSLLEKAGTSVWLVPLMTDKPVLAMFDPEQGQVIDRVEMPGVLMNGIHGIGELRVSGDKVYIVSWRFSYGVWTGFGYVDLKEKKFTPLKLPGGLNHGSSEVTLGSAGKLFLCSAEAAHQYDSQGKLIGAAFGKDEGRLLGVWRGQALLLKGDELRRGPLPRLSAQAN